MTTWVLLAGLPGCGKSALARALSRRLNRKDDQASPAAVTLDKDMVRATLFPGALTDYTREQDDLCMRAILSAAAYLTAQGSVRFILLDGRTFSRRSQIDEVLAAAGRAGAAWRILHLSCPDEVAEARLSETEQRPRKHPARNRDVALYRRLKQSWEPILQAKFDVDSSRAMEANLRAVLQYLEA